MIYKDICSKREYEKNGEKKVKWLNVGTLRVNDEGKEFIELNLFPNTPLYVFEQKQKNAAPAQEVGETWLDEGK